MNCPQGDSPEPDAKEESSLSRRNAVAGTALVAVGGVLVLAGCSSEKSHGSVEDIVASKAQELIHLDQIPKGKGVVIAHANVVLIRDEADGVTGFSALCTHKGCVVAEVTDKSINCPCHGSRFDVKTGKTIAGPAKKPLPSVAVHVSNGIVMKG
jgi:Rieske Fe-S protein